MPHQSIETTRTIKFILNKRTVLALCNSENCELILSLLFLDLCILPFTQVNGKYILKFTASARGLLVNQVFSYVGTYLYHEWRI